MGQGENRSEGGVLQDIPRSKILLKWSFPVALVCFVFKAETLTPPMAAIPPVTSLVILQLAGRQPWGVLHWVVLTAFTGGVGLLIGNGLGGLLLGSETLALWGFLLSQVLLVVTQDIH